MSGVLNLRICLLSTLILVVGLLVVIVFFSSEVVASQGWMSGASMTTEQRLEILWGGLFALLGLSLIFQRKHWLEYAEAVMSNPTYLMLLCIASLLPSLTIILWHNVWVSNFSVILTIMGWVMVVGFSVIVVMPGLILPIYRWFSLSDKAFLVIGKGLGLLLIGVLLILGSM